MKKRITLKGLKQSFQRVLPQEDARTQISPLNFVTGIVFCFLSDTKSFGLEAMRRFLISRFEVSISKGAFWERLSGQRLKTMLEEVLAELMTRLSCQAVSDLGWLSQLKVKGIYLLDSSTLSLWQGARHTYPGAWTTAAVKWHACFELLSGQLRWFELTPGTTHDRQCFPSLKSLAGQLVLFDLGYWDYGLLLSIDAAKGFFLSRIKSHSTIRIQQVVYGLSEVWVGRKLSELKPKRKKKDLIEVRGEIVHEKQTQVFRMVGFWNPSEKKYHWYITNLVVSASLLYPLYRLRWTIELIFKASKRSFNLDKRLSSTNENIIETLVLSSIIASFASSLVLHLGSKHLTEQQCSAISFQRLAQIVVQLAGDFIDYITLSNPGFASRLTHKIKLFAPEMFEKNYRYRPTSLARVQAQLAS